MDLIRNNEFKVTDMVYFIETGFDFQKSIMYGVVIQKDYATVDKENTITLLQYHVKAINCYGDLKTYKLDGSQVFKTIDELIKDLLSSYDPGYNLETFVQYMNNKPEVIFNNGIRESLQKNYELESLRYLENQNGEN